nr:hypothetical protein [Paenibacillus sp. MDMC362]
MALLQTVICLKNTRMPIREIKQYMDWIQEGDTTIERRLEMMTKHKQNVLDEISLMTDSLQGIDEKIKRYTDRIKEERS